MKTNSKINEKRQYLKGLSLPIRSLVKEGRFNSVNEGLKEIYAENGHKELKTIRQWNRNGKQVKKGESALLLWGSPRKFEVVNADTSEVDEMDFYPICFVFSNIQVTEGNKVGKA